MRAHASLTAEAVCLFRALEAQRPVGSRILDDPFASAFLSAAGRLLLRAGQRGRSDPIDRLGSGIATFAVARHGYIDRAVGAALEEGVDQLVILGAGYDTRAWRFADRLRERPVIEIDHPATAARKAERVARFGARWPAVDRRVVSADLQVETLAHALARGGYRPGLPAIFVWEGVSMYLDEAAVRRTLGLLGQGAPGGRVVMDLLDPRALVGTEEGLRRLGTGALQLLGEPVTFGLSAGQGAAYLAGLGLRLDDHADAAELRRRHVPDGRPVYPTAWCLEARIGAR